MACYVTPINSKSLRTLQDEQVYRSTCFWYPLEYRCEGWQILPPLDEAEDGGQDAAAAADRRPGWYVTDLQSAP